MKSLLKTMKNLEKLSPLNEVLEISAKHELVEDPAAILWHSKNKKSVLNNMQNFTHGSARSKDNCY